MFLDLPLEHRSRHGTDHRVDVPAILEEEDGRNGADVVAHRGLLIRVDVELRHGYAAGVFARELLQDRRDHAARAAPRCPEVHDRQALPALDLGGECRICYGDRAAVLTHSALLLRWRAGLTGGDAACYLVKNIEPLQKTRRSPRVKPVLDHVAIAVESLATALPLFESLTGGAGSAIEEVAA